MPKLNYWEYKLKSFLENYGIVIRIAGSGISSFGDLVFINYSVFKEPLIIECKQTSKDFFYISSYEPQVSSLIEATKKYGGIPVLAVRFKNYGYIFINLIKNENIIGSKIDKSFVQIKKLKFEDFVYEIKNRSFWL